MVLSGACIDRLWQRMIPRVGPAKSQIDLSFPGLLLCRAGKVDAAVQTVYRMLQDCNEVCVPPGPQLANLALCVAAVGYESCSATDKISWRAGLNGSLPPRVTRTCPAVRMVDEELLLHFCLVPCFDFRTLVSASHANTPNEQDARYEALIAQAQEWRCLAARQAVDSVQELANQALVCKQVGQELIAQFGTQAEATLCAPKRGACTLPYEADHSNVMMNALFGMQASAYEMTIGNLLAINEAPLPPEILNFRSRSHWNRGDLAGCAELCMHAHGRKPRAAYAR